MTTGSRETLRSQQERYRRNYKEPISLIKQDTGFNLFKRDSFNEDEPAEENNIVAAKREIKKVVLIDDRIPRERLRTKTIYLGDSVSWNQANFAINRRMFGKVIEIIKDNFSINNVNETIFRIRINTGAVVNVRGYKLL